VLCLPGGLAAPPFYDDVLAEPAPATSGVRAIATTLPGFGRVPGVGVEPTWLGL
jgi:hypothetical protein